MPLVAPGETAELQVPSSADSGAAAASTTAAGQLATAADPVAPAAAAVAAVAAGAEAPLTAMTAPGGAAAGVVSAQHALPGKYMQPWQPLPVGSVVANQNCKWRPSKLSLTVSSRTES
jgi:hypothetical protein